MKDDERLAVWDELVAQSNATGEQPTRYKVLPLRREPRRRHLVNTPRTLAGIEPTLRGVLRDLAMGKKPWPLFLYGPVGTGKTAASLCLLDHSGGEHVTAEALCADLVSAQHGRLERRGHSGPYDVSQEELWRILDRAPLVVLDELGTRGIISDHHYAAVKTLVDMRDRRPFVAIANDRTCLSNIYDGRIASRLLAGTEHELRGADRRRPMKEARP